LQDTLTQPTLLGVRSLSLGPSLPSGPKSSKTLLFPYREIFTHNSFHMTLLPRLYRRIKTSRLANSRSIFWALESPRTDTPVNSDFSSLVRTSVLVTISPIMTPNARFSNLRYAISQNVDTHNFASLRLRYSRGQSTSSSAPDARDAKMPISRITLLWPTLSKKSSGLRFSLYHDTCDQIFRSFLTMVR
jgi:hypothetical protein